MCSFINTCIFKTHLQIQKDYKCAINGRIRKYCITHRKKNTVTQKNKTLEHVEYTYELITAMMNR